MPLHEQVARQTTTVKHLTAQVVDGKAELKAALEENRALQGELPALARQTPGGKIV